MNNSYLYNELNKKEMKIFNLVNEQKILNKKIKELEEDNDDLIRLLFKIVEECNEKINKRTETK